MCDSRSEGAPAHARAPPGKAGAGRQKATSPRTGEVLKKRLPERNRVTSYSIWPCRSPHIWCLQEAKGRGVQRRGKIRKDFLKRQKAAKKSSTQMANVGVLAAVQELQDLGILMKKPDKCPQCNYGRLSQPTVRTKQTAQCYYRCLDSDCGARTNVFSCSDVLPQRKMQGLTPTQVLMAVKAYRATGCKKPPSPLQLARLTGAGRRALEPVVDALMDHEASQGRALSGQAVFTGQCEADGTCLRTLRISSSSRTFANQVALWKRAHSGRAVPRRFLLYVRCLGVTQRNSQKMAIAPAHLTLVPLPSKPPSESVQEIKDSGLLRQLAAGAIVYTDGCASWKTSGKALPRKRLHFRKVVHNKSEWTKVTRVNLRARRAGTQQIDRCWHHLKKIMPSEMKSRGPSGLINSRLWTRAYQFLYRRSLCA